MTARDKIGLTVAPSPCPWFMRYSFPYDCEVLRDTLRAIPGVHWNAKEKCYMVPIEVHWLIQRGEI
jgi:hypothetical protein